MGTLNTSVKDNARHRLYTGTVSCYAEVPRCRHGLQAALLQERMRYAFDSGCDLAMMVAMPGSDSQRNAERSGFRIAYTRTKWQLS